MDDKLTIPHLMRYVVLKRDGKMGALWLGEGGMCKLRAVGIMVGPGDMISRTDLIALIESFGPVPGLRPQPVSVSRINDLRQKFTQGVA